jgi:hypothetical protein
LNKKQDKPIKTGMINVIDNGTTLASIFLLLRTIFTRRIEHADKQTNNQPLLNIIPSINTKYVNKINNVKLQVSLTARARFG